MQNRLWRLLLVGVMLAVPLAAHADGTLTTHVIGSTTAPYGFVDYLPPGYDASTRSYPLVVALHGQGESGDGFSWLTAAVTTAGPLKLIQNDLAAVPVRTPYFATNQVVVVAPQSPGWWNSGSINTFIDYVVANYRIDPERIYVTGLSMGGGGTIGYQDAYPDRLAAVLAICQAAGVRGSPASSFAQTPAWMVHAWDDPRVPRIETISWANAVATTLNAGTPDDLLATYPHAGGDVSRPASDTMTGLYMPGGGWDWRVGVDASGDAPLRVTLYTDGSHDAWTRTYDRTEVWDWLLRQTRSGTVVVPPDAGVPDAGGPIDLGVPDVDAGPAADLGAPDLDAGTAEDGGGAVTDGGPMDAAAGDAGSRDAGPRTDGGGADVDASGPTHETITGGCSAARGASGDRSTLLGLVSCVVGMIATKRRRRR